MKLNKVEFTLMNNPLRRLIQEWVEIQPFTKVENFVAGKSVLEIGCGSGNGARLINKYFNPKTIVGIDLDPRMIRLAKRDRQANTTFEVGNATNLRFKENSIDGVFDFGVIHHISEWKKSVTELHRVLKQGGQIFLEDFSIESFNTLLGRVFRMVLDHPYESMYERQEFISYLERVGFTLEKQEVRKPLGIIAYFVVVGRKQ